jgi:hypothetical protein
MDMFDFGGAVARHAADDDNDDALQD